MIKKKEANDIVHFLLPKLDKLGFSFEVDTSTVNTQRLRGDCWLLDKDNNRIGLIEAKSTYSVIGDNDWKDAMRQGKIKASSEGFPFYIVTNCNQYTRFYNSYSDEEICIDMLVITNLVNIETLLKLNQTINPTNSNYSTSKSISVKEHTQQEFTQTLRLIRNKYRSVGLDKDKLISPTISFIIIKYISELENETQTLPKNIQLWDAFPIENIKSSINQFRKSLWHDKEYQNNRYADFKNLIHFPEELTNQTYIDIYKELSAYNFHGSIKFDIFGAVYEEYATKNAKQQFGEYYTRRHITTIAARMLLLNVQSISENTKIGDPACGTGGFLTEAFQYLDSTIQDKTQKELLKTNTFWGFDSNVESINRTKLNMFLSGDGHNNINHIQDSLKWDSKIGWKENTFDYILANPPMGKYDGTAPTESFFYSTQKRMETLFLEKIVRSLKFGGRACVVVNDGPLENPSFAEFRKKFLLDVTVEAIVSLNKWVFAPYTKEKTYLVFFKKKYPSELPTGEMRLTIQTEPIYHYILDYDGFAQSDNRYRTKYHDDIPELEMQLKLLFSGLQPEERKVNSVEQQDNLFGWKSLFVNMKDIEQNMYILTSEKYLRNETYIDFNSLLKKIDTSILEIERLLSNGKNS